MANRGQSFSFYAISSYVHRATLKRRYYCSIFDNLDQYTNVCKLYFSFGTLNLHHFIIFRSTTRSWQYWVLTDHWEISPWYWSFDQFFIEFFEQNPTFSCFEVSWQDQWTGTVQPWVLKRIVLFTLLTNRIQHRPKLMVIRIQSAGLMYLSIR